MALHIACMYEIQVLLWRTSECWVFRVGFDWCCEIWNVNTEHDNRALCKNPTFVAINIETVIFAGCHCLAMLTIVVINWVIIVIFIVFMKCDVMWCSIALRCPASQREIPANLYNQLDPQPHQLQTAKKDSKVMTPIWVFNMQLEHAIVEWPAKGCQGILFRRCNPRCLVGLRNDFFRTGGVFRQLEQ